MNITIESMQLLCDLFFCKNYLAKLKVIKLRHKLQNDHSSSIFFVPLCAGIGCIFLFHLTNFRSISSE